jgi:hypothetical protein
MYSLIELWFKTFRSTHLYHEILKQEFFEHLQNIKKH